MEEPPGLGDPPLRLDLSPAGPVPPSDAGSPDDPQPDLPLWLARTMLALPGLAAVVLALVVRLPILELGPGPARDVAPLIDVVEEQTFDSRGEFLLTTITYRPATAVDAITAWIDPVEEIVPREEIFPAGVTVEQNEQITRSQMDGSKIAAAFVVLSRLTGYPETHGEGVLVQGIRAEAPADGSLFPGDLIVEINGRPAESKDVVASAINGTPPGGSVHLKVTAGGEERELDLVPISVPDVDHPIIGVTLVENFPFEISIASSDIGGPSAGLMWSLGLYDLLTPGDLTGGRRIAGTGTMDLEGNVGPIGGVRFKVEAAERAGADVFLVPEGNFEEAERVADGIELVRVGDLDDALDYLLIAGA